MQNTVLNSEMQQSSGRNEMKTPLEYPDNLRIFSALIKLPGMDEKYFDIVWRYYELHAKQRIENFRIYLVLVTAAFSLLGYFYKDASLSRAYLLFPCGVYLLSSIIFLLLDLRTVELIDNALYSLKNYENYLKASVKHKDVENYIYDLFNHHYRDKDIKKPRYRMIFKMFYMANILVALLLMVTFCIALVR
jgi:hypothetical protein